MKKKLSLIIMFFTFSTVYLYSQIDMYKGIKSGITETELIANLRSNPEFTLNQVSADVSYFQTVISGRTYELSYTFNRDGALNRISFNSTDRYDTLNYAKVIDNGKEVSALLYKRYGEPYYGDWVSWKSVMIAEPSSAYWYGMDPDVAEILVASDLPGRYFIRLTFKDTGLIFANEEEESGDSEEDEEYDEYDDF